MTSVEWVISSGPGFQGPLRQDGHLHHRWQSTGGYRDLFQLFVPRQLFPRVLQFINGSVGPGHFGVAKTLQQLQSQLYWPGRRQDVRALCSSVWLLHSSKWTTMVLTCSPTAVPGGGPNWASVYWGLCEAQHQKDSDYTTRPPAMRLGPSPSLPFTKRTPAILMFGHELCTPVHLMS